MSAAPSQGTRTRSERQVTRPKRPMEAPSPGNPSGPGSDPSGYGRLATRLRVRTPAYLSGAVLMLGATCAALLVFLAMVRIIGDPDVVPAMDLRVQRTVESILTPTTIHLMVIITSLGGVVLMTLFSLTLAVALWSRRRWVHLFELLVAVPLGAAAMLAMKQFFQRTRPVEALLDVRGLSFPSGHAFISMVFFGFVIHLLFRSRLNPAWIAGGTSLALALIALIGTSRVYLGVHFLTDVVGGYAAGFLWLVLALRLVRYVERRRAARGRPAVP
ncbi:MAG: phosphatase PAP2 family protein [Gemmatimonadales bacterium]|nr:MAG: phosphatase PAP2 family protein [Gemmatimonadales bacterium]